MYQFFTEAIQGMHRKRPNRCGVGHGRPHRGCFQSTTRFSYRYSGTGMNSVIFLVPGGLVHRPDLAMPEAQFLSYIQLIHALGADQPVYGLRRLGLGDILKSYRSLEDLAARYVNAVLAFQPHGPYLFVGDCVGGIFAYEIVRQLSLQPSKQPGSYSIPNSRTCPTSEISCQNFTPTKKRGPTTASRQQDPKELESARCHGWPFYLQ